MDLERKCDAGKRKALAKMVPGKGHKDVVCFYCKGFAPFMLRLLVRAGDKREVLLCGGRDGKVDALAVSAYRDVTGGDGGGERVGVSDDDQSRFHPPGELEAEGRERARHLLRGGVCDICAI